MRDQLKITEINVGALQSEGMFKRGNKSRNRPDKKIINI